MAVEPGPMAVDPGLMLVKQFVIAGIASLLSVKPTSMWQRDSCYQGLLR